MFAIRLVLEQYPYVSLSSIWSMHDPSCVLTYFNGVYIETLLKGHLPMPGHLTESDLHIKCPDIFLIRIHFRSLRGVHVRGVPLNMPVWSMADPLGSNWGCVRCMHMSCT